MALNLSIPKNLKKGAWAKSDGWVAITANFAGPILGLSADHTYPAIARLSGGSSSTFETTVHVAHMESFDATVSDVLAIWVPNVTPDEQFGLEIEVIGAGVETGLRAFLQGAPTSHA